jgi:hypothetical protein
MATKNGNGKDKDGKDKDGKDKDRQTRMFETRARNKKRANSGLSQARRVAKLIVIPPEVWATRAATVSVENLTSERFGICQPQDFIAPGEKGYQREEVRHWVPVLSDVLRRGGESEPIHVVSREWEPLPRRYWIVDGQQRFWAHVDSNKPIRILVHDVEKPWQERALFDAFNARRGVNAGLRIWNHDGPVMTKLLRPANEEPLSPLFGRIGFHSRNRISSNLLVAALGRGIGRSNGATGEIALALTKLDAAITRDGLLTKMQALLNLIGMVFMLPPPGIAVHSGEVHALTQAWRDAGCPMQTVTQLVPKLRVVASRLHKVIAATPGERIVLMTRKFAAVLRPVEQRPS